MERYALVTCESAPPPQNQIYVWPNILETMERQICCYLNNIIWWVPGGLATPLNNLHVV